MKKKMSRKAAVLLAAAILAIATGTAAGVSTAPEIRSSYYRTHFYLNHLQVHLLENGVDVCGGQNNLDGESKVTGRLAASLGYKDFDNLGSVEPGILYREEIAARNGQDISQFLRLTVRRYWVLTDENDKVITDETGKPKKTTELSPRMIHLMYDGEEGYNTSAWTENESERTTESRTYYYNSLVKDSEDTELLFDQIMIDPSLGERGEDKVTAEGGKTIYTHVYKYDGCAFFIEADVQAIQPHNAQDAIKSQWGVDNVKATYSDEGDTETGSLSVSN